MQGLVESPSEFFGGQSTTVTICFAMFTCVRPLVALSVTENPIWVTSLLIVSRHKTCISKLCPSAQLSFFSSTSQSRPSWIVNLAHMIVALGILGQMQMISTTKTLALQPQLIHPQSSTCTQRTAWRWRLLATRSLDVKLFVLSPVFVTKSGPGITNLWCLWNTTRCPGWRSPPATCQVMFLRIATFGNRWVLKTYFDWQFSCLRRSEPLVGLLIFLFSVLNGGGRSLKNIEQYFVIEVRKGNPDLWLWLGDNAYSDGTSMDHKRSK